ncbi:unnamed protein product [Cyprideis torosa]|uniref:Nuclear pore complex protein n=1 Tax=Cyprideis torosa TaxID=163714 RepID=A0A7R8WN62_9CRUS|nr:unnamed protein product [Cyprideis torosa]CAG0900310.1 unnamed protein product [Cyprideis torosa]
MDLSSAEGALEEAMRLALDFLFAKKLDATRQLIEKLPPEWSRHSSRHPSAATLVLSHTLLLLLALEAHARWKAHLNLRPKAPAAPPSSAEFSVQVAFETTKKNHRAEDAKWKANLTFYAKNVVSRVHAVFLAQPCGWMWGTEQLNNLQLPAKYFPLLAEILLDVSEQETQLVDVASVLTFPRVREALSVSQMGSLLQHLEAKMKGTLESGGDPLLPDAV